MLVWRNFTLEAGIWKDEFKITYCWLGFLFCSLIYTQFCTNLRCLMWFRTFPFQVHAIFSVHCTNLTVQKCFVATCTVFSPFVYWEYCVKCLRISIVFKNKANIKFKLVSDVYLARVRHLSNIHATKSHVPLVCCLLWEKNIFPGGIGGGRKFFGNSRGVGGTKSQEIPEGMGGKRRNFRPEGRKLIDFLRMSIGASYLL